MGRDIYWCMKYVLTENQLSDLLKKITGQKKNSFIYEYLNKNYTPHGGWIKKADYERMLKELGVLKLGNFTYDYFNIIKDKETQLNKLVVSSPVYKELDYLFEYFWEPTMVKWIKDKTGISIDPKIERIRANYGKKT